MDTSGQVVYAPSNIASQFAAHPSANYCVSPTNSSRFWIRSWDKAKFKMVVKQGDESISV